MAEVNCRHLHLNILTDEDVVRIHMASLEVLERTGLFVESPHALELLRGAGAIVSENRARIPSFLVEEALRTVPKRVVICNRDGKRLLFLEGNKCYFTALLDNFEVLDPFTRTRQVFLSSHYRMTAKVVDACPNLWGACAGGNAEDYPPEVRAQVAFKYSIPHMAKPFSSHPLNARQVADIYEMAAVIAGGWDQLREAPFVIATCEPTTPLGLFNDATEILLLAASEKMPVVWYPMPSAGTTAPCSGAAAITTGNAEVLAGLVVHQLESPGAPFIYGAMPGTTDMRSTQWAFGSPDLALHVAASTDLAHSYGLPMFGTAGCTDSYEIDQQAAAEATMHCLMSILSGANLVHDTGLMGGSTLTSPEMMVLCDEIIEMVEHATREINTSPEEFALELINQVGPQGNYLALDRTLANFRRFHHSGIFLRNRLTGDLSEDGRETVRERISKRTIDMIDSHEVAPLPCEVLKELDELEKKWMARV